MGKIQHIEIPIDEIILLDENPRDITDSDLEKLANDIQKDPTFLHQRPSLINLKDGKYFCYAGSQRVKAQKLLGQDKAICFVEEDVPDKVQQERRVKFKGQKRIFICKHCDGLFHSKKYTKNRKPEFCSRKCYGLHKRQIKICEFCGTKYYSKTSFQNIKYCSYDCSHKARKGVKLSRKWKKSISEGRNKSSKCKGENLYNWKGGKRTYKERVVLYTNKARSKTKMPLDELFIKKLIILQNYKCFYCESDLSNYKEIEHLTPFDKGGDNYNNNLVYSCKSCNSKKGTKTLLEYSSIINRPELIDKHIELCFHLKINLPNDYLEVSNIL